MEVKTKLVEGAPHPDLRVGVRCVLCGFWSLYVVPLSKVVPRILWGKARSALEPLHGDLVSVPGVHLCDDCGAETLDLDTDQQGESDADADP